MALWVLVTAFSVCLGTLEVCFWKLYIGVHLFLYVVRVEWLGWVIKEFLGNHNITKFSRWYLGFVGRCM